jgi:hypothetical protein
MSKLYYGPALDITGQRRVGMGFAPANARAWLGSWPRLEVPPEALVHLLASFEHLKIWPRLGGSIGPAVPAIHLESPGARQVPLRENIQIPGGRPGMPGKQGKLR